MYFFTEIYAEFAALTGKIEKVHEVNGNSIDTFRPIWYYHTIEFAWENTVFPASL